MPEYQIFNDDILKWAAAYDGPKFHACFGDWPYNLESIRKRFGSASAAPAQYGRDGAFSRQSRGFMNQQWDTGIAYEPETWELLSRLLLPGAFTASFSHARTEHRLAMAQELAGYVINPSIYSYGHGSVTVPPRLAWAYGSGKPNGTRVDLMIDNRAGAEREIVGKKKLWGHNAGNGSGSFYANSYQATTGKIKEQDITLPATPLAQTWAGWQYGSPLKPELEPIILAQNPYDNDPIDSITETGAGAINIAFGQNGKVGGRFPGYLVLHHHPGCRQTGWKETKNGSGDITGKEASQPAKRVYAGGYNRIPFQAHGDENGMEQVPAYECHPDCPIPRLEAQAGGEKAHYFYQADWSFEVAQELARVDPVFYGGKVGTKERNAGCFDLPLQIRNRVNPGGLENEPRFAPTLQQNNHPTLKSIKLCQWIAGLLLPPAEYAPRRILVPCSGSGSEIIGALMAGWDEVIGIELQPEYHTISQARVAWWSKWLEWGQTDVDKILAAAEPKQGQAIQQTLF